MNTRKFCFLENRNLDGKAQAEESGTYEEKTCKRRETQKIPLYESRRQDYRAPEMTRRQVN